MTRNASDIDEHCGMDEWCESANSIEIQSNLRLCSSLVSRVVVIDDDSMKWRAQKDERWARPRLAATTNYTEIEPRRLISSETITLPLSCPAFLGEGRFDVRRPTSIRGSMVSTMAIRGERRRRGKLKSTSIET